MTERALVALSFLGLLALLVAAVRAWLRYRDGRLIERLNVGAGRGTGGARPRIVYFTTKTCSVCRLRQEPALDALAAHLPALVLERHDAVEDRALAAQFSVLSVPTTVIYDREGVLVAINRGFTPAAVLLAQIEGRDVTSEGGLTFEAEEVSGAR